MLFQLPSPCSNSLLIGKGIVPATNFLLLELHTVSTSSILLHATRQNRDAETHIADWVVAILSTVVWRI